MDLCLRIGLRTALATRWKVGEWAEERSRVAATVGDGLCTGSAVWRGP